MEEEIIELRHLLKDIIETLDGRDNSLRQWVVDRYLEIESTLPED